MNRDKLTLTPTDEERKRIRTIVLDALRPAGSATEIPMDAFKSMFSFISDVCLREHLAEALYQARLANRLGEILDLPGGFPHLFLKTQIVHYASIYEAIIDLYLEPHKSEFRADTLVEVSGALGAGTTLARNGQSLVIAERKSKPIPIHDVRFENRLIKAIALGIVHANQRGVVLDVYNARNKIHLLSAAKKGYKPSKKLVMQAYSELPHFLEHIRIVWLKKKSLDDHASKA